MKLKELENEIPEFVFEKLCKEIKELNPPQKLAIKEGLLDGESLIVSSPTASGKTLIATLAISKILKENQGKALYIVPLRALANEKYSYYKHLLEPSFKVAISTGDLDSKDSWLYNKDLIIITSEKLDSLLRHGTPWISQVKLVIGDEIHLLNDAERGPTLEVTLTRLRELIDFQFLGLSATIKNSKELSSWLNCKLVKSDYRPVKLEEGILCQNTIEFYDINKSKGEFVRGVDFENEISWTVGLENLYNSTLLNIISDTLKNKKQAIIFLKSRRSAESVAKKAIKVVENFLDKKEKNGLKELSKKAENVLSSPTKQCRALGFCLRGGVAFHHAGLLAEQKKTIENNFRKGLIKIITATPTLAMGVSLPSYRVIIRDLKRYGSFGMRYIPVLEYKQFAGRAGRPEYNLSGQAISIAKDFRAKEEIKKRYIFGEVESIYSKLAVEPVLRTHILSLIATHSISTENELMDFFSRTFYAYQYKDLHEISNKLSEILEKLKEYGFISGEEKLEATLIGKRVSELYIDPFTANYLISNLEKVNNSKVHEIGLLKLICDTIEMMPLLNLKKADYKFLEEILPEAEKFLFGKVPKEWDYEYDSFLRSFKTALSLYDWISESGEDKIMEKFGVTPGGLRIKIENADWLLYACREFCTIKKWKRCYSQIEKLRLRLKYGIKEELFPLIKFKGIGRVKARVLYENNIKSVQDLRNASFKTLKNLLGNKTALNLKKELGESVFDRENVLDYFKS